MNSTSFLLFKRTFCEVQRCLQKWMKTPAAVGQTYKPKITAVKRKFLDNMYMLIILLPYFKTRIAFKASNSALVIFNDSIKLTAISIVVKLSSKLAYFGRKTET
uniref:Uncharacterized protein n=1 Tax=Romanomermis culicivorax TaxID=13658 RepID=A0A915JNG6_ROMCU